MVWVCGWVRGGLSWCLAGVLRYHTSQQIELGKAYIDMLVAPVLCGDPLLHRPCDVNPGWCEAPSLLNVVPQLDIPTPNPRVLYYINCDTASHCP